MFPMLAGRILIFEVQKEVVTQMSFTLVLCVRVRERDGQTGAVLRRCRLRTWLSHSLSAIFLSLFVIGPRIDPIVVLISMLLSLLTIRLPNSWLEACFEKQCVDVVVVD